MICKEKANNITNIRWLYTAKNKLATPGISLISLTLKLFILYQRHFHQIFFPRKTIQNTPFQQHPIFSNTEMLWGGFLFMYNFFLHYVSFIEKFVILRVKYFIPYYCIYRNVIPQNLNSLLRPGVAVWTLAVWFHAFFFFLNL